MNGAMARFIKAFVKILIVVIITTLLLNYVEKRVTFHIGLSLQLPGTMHLNKRSIILEKGESVQLHLNAINKRISYESTDFKVAWVSPSGKVYGLRSGSAIIKAKVDKKVFKCRVRVIDLSDNRLVMNIGQTKKLKVSGTLAHKTYKSSSPNVVSVSKNGRVTALKKGKATITVTVKGKKMVCKVIVR